MKRLIFCSFISLLLIAMYVDARKRVVKNSAFQAGRENSLTTACDDAAVDGGDSCFFTLSAINTRTGTFFDSLIVWFTATDEGHDSAEVARQTLPFSNLQSTSDTAAADIYTTIVNDTIGDAATSIIISPAADGYPTKYRIRLHNFKGDDTLNFDKVRAYGVEVEDIR